MSAAEVRVQVRPAWPLRLPRMNGMDGVLRCRRGVLHRLLHAGDEPVVVRVAQLASGDVLFGATARRRADAEWGIARMRFATGVDDDLSAFVREFRDDPWIGRSVRATPGLRARRRPLPWEALAWAVTEQLIETERAAQIQRRMVWRWGRRCPETGLRDVPPATVVARQAPARLCAMDLAEARALAMLRAAREVGAGRVDLSAADPAPGWRRLLALRGIGPWTVECLALLGQGRYDQLPAGDLAYVKLVGRLRSGGDPRARAEIDDVRDAFARFGEWKGLAGLHALRAGALARGRPAPLLAA